MDLRIHRDQELALGRDRFVADVVESAWSRFVEDHAVGYAQVGDELVWRVRRGESGGLWRVVHQLRTKAPPRELARARVPGCPPREGDHLELVHADDPADWRFCTVRFVDQEKVTADEAVGDAPATVMVYEPNEFYEQWGLLPGLTLKGDGEAALSPKSVSCGACGMPDKFFAPRWQAVRCRECGEYLPDWS